MNGFKQVFAGSKFIIRKDGTFDLCIFQNYRHGKWKQDDQQLILFPEPLNDSLIFHIDTLSIEWMQLSIDTNHFNKLGRFVMPYQYGLLIKRRQFIHFRFSLDKESYSKTTKDPYSKENNWWRIRPVKPESSEAIHKRVLNLVDFHLCMFEDAKERDKNVITYDWFSSPLIVANNGLALQNYRKIKGDWEECFYDSTQAAQAYQLLRAGFSRSMRFPAEIKNPFERSIAMLKQYRKNIQ